MEILVDFELWYEGRKMFIKINSKPVNKIITLFLINCVFGNETNLSNLGIADRLK